MCTSFEPDMMRTESVLSCQNTKSKILYENTMIKLNGAWLDSTSESRMKMICRTLIAASATWTATQNVQLVLNIYR